MELNEYALMDAAEAGMWWYRALHARLGTALAGVRGPILDAGCGTGGLLAGLPGGQLFGLEYVAVAARRAAEKSGARIACGSINAMPFADGSFAAAVAADVLCHEAVAPVAALAELRRVLQPGGRLVVNMPAYGWLASAHDRRVHNARRATAGSLRRQLQAAGFAGVRVRYWTALLLPLMVVQRKVLARGAAAASDVANFSPWLDAILFAVTDIERRLPGWFPAGGSILATATRPEI